MELISVVIPAYKVEKYIRKCIDSVLNQSYRNIEIILVDDGSPDHCGTICDEYADLDRRIKVIHKENGGAADARNAGIDSISGSYMTFIDSDDFVCKDYIEVLYNTLIKTKSDISICDFHKIYENEYNEEYTGISTNNEMISVFTPEKAIEAMLYQHKFDTEPCGKLYKTTLFSDIRYPKGKLYEDFGTIYKVFDKAKSISFINAKKYFYLQRSDSTQARLCFNPEKMSGIEFARDIIGFVQSKYPNIVLAAKCRTVIACFNLLFQIEKDKYKEYEIYLKEQIKSYRTDIIFDLAARKKIRIACMLSFLGFNVPKSIFHFLRRT